MTASQPLDRQTIAALRVVGKALGQDSTFVDQGQFIFPLADGWALSLTPDDAGRFRVAACYGATEVGTLWALANDFRRLADLAKAFRQETSTLTA